MRMNPLSPLSICNYWHGLVMLAADASVQVAHRCSVSIVNQCTHVCLQCWDLCYSMRPTETELFYVLIVQKDLNWFTGFTNTRKLSL